MGIRDMTDMGLDSDAQARIISSSGEEILRLWCERVKGEIPSIAASGKPALLGFMPALYNTIAESIAPCGTLPFTCGNTCDLGDILCADEHVAEFRADDIIKELQIFRSVVFSFAKRRRLILSEQQCEIVGHLIDVAIRDAITACTAIDREMRQSFISELSHDLRNPLNVASALAQLIQRRPDNEKVAMMATRIYEKIAETDAMIQSTVDSMSKRPTAPKPE